MIGEKGKEYVLNERQMKSRRGGGGLSIGDINISGGNGWTADEIGRVAGAHITQKLKTSGQFVGRAKKAIRGGL